MSYSDVGYDIGYFLGAFIIPAILILAGYLAGKALTREGERAVKWPLAIAVVLSAILLLGMVTRPSDAQGKVQIHG